MRADISALKPRLNQLSSDIRDKAIVAAINKTADKGRVEMKRQIAAEYAIKAGYVNAQLDVRPATTKGFSIQASIVAFGRRRGKRSMNMVHFLERKVSLAEARRRGKAGTLGQLGFKVKRSGGIKMIKGAFLGNNGRTVFIREGKGRLPIKAVQVIDVPQMFNAKRINMAVVQKIRAEFPIEMQRAIAKYSRPRV